MDEGATLPRSTPAPPISMVHQSSSPCPTCGSSTSTIASGQRQYALAFGKLRMSYRDESMEKHFTQVIGQRDGKGPGEVEAVREALLQPKNRYLARLGCWTLDIMDSPAYVVYPSGEDYNVLIEALRPAKASTFDVLLGEIDGVASFEECPGQQLPRLVIQTAYVIDKEQIIKESAKLEKSEEAGFESIVGEIFDGAMQANRGIGADAAKNYVFLFYLKTYTLAARKISEGSALLSVDARPSKLSGPHHLTTVGMNFRNLETDLTERYCCTVDQTSMFPYLVDPWRRTYDLSSR